MIQFRMMRQEERRACAQLAADSFMDYVFFINYVSNEKRRQQFLRKMIDCEMRLNESQAVNLIAQENENIVAVAILYPPTYKKPSDTEYMLSGFLGAMIAGGLKDTSAWNEMNEQNDTPCRNLNGAWYINLLTVAPDYKGMGIGSRMLRECIFPYVSEQGGKELCLVTNSEENCRFYEKNGFVRFHFQEFRYKGNRTGSWSYKL